MNFTDNQSILNAIGGLGLNSTGTTLSTGLDTQMPGASGQMDPSGLSNQSQLPQMQSPLQGNPGYMNTIQRFFAGPQSTFNNPMQQPMRHTPGRDSWSSGMGLDHQTIMNNIGLGGQR